VFEDYDQGYEQANNYQGNDEYEYQCQSEVQHPGKAMMKPEMDVLKSSNDIGMFNMPDYD